MTLNIIPLLPEILLLTMVCMILIMDAYLTDHTRGLVYHLTQGSLLGTLLMVFSTFPHESTITMNGMFIHDPMGALLKIFILFIGFFVFIYSRPYLRERNLLKGEYFVLGLLAILGMMVMVSAHSLLTLYLGLELLSLSLYTMVAMHRTSQHAIEAAMKYFVLGALASGMLLYGMSILYGVTGTLDLGQLAQVITEQKTNQLLVFGLVFIVIGLAFKLGAVPFHVWIPDVYQGAPTSVTLFISTAPKLAAFAMLMRLLVGGLEDLYPHWQQILILLSLLSMGLGNLTAIAQTNIKRMFAYSTIAHVGYLMLGILTANKGGYAASMFYTIVYSLMSLGGFGMVILLSRAGFEAEEINDFKGLNDKSPWYAFIMLILMLSMAGVPPMLGFWAKFSVLNQVVQAGFVWLAVAAVLFAIIGAFYYLRIVWIMYFEKPQDAVPIQTNTELQVALSANGLLILILGLAPQSLMALCLGALGM